MSVFHLKRSDVQALIKDWADADFDGDVTAELVKNNVQPPTVEGLRSHLNHLTDEQFADFK